MKHLSLATRYRPQTFSEVAGQPMAATALSRAAAENKVAPAYLLSGTRGVGKTTIARIFAKALNCEHGPAAEPCNKCVQCSHVTAGNHVDVCEIDAASNTGVDDVRALRETIGFLPMEGRYKVFIVDEAHMLSKSAFNALLKTLEEPPAHTVFIFATTEAHRFPATIISRCQHFVFRHLPEQAIFGHLTKILGMEGVDYDESAVRLLARRAAGSVRDSLSLLDQALALGGDKLETGSVREALGLAGPELFGNLLTAIAGRDCAGIVALAGELLASGVDLGFFTRELSGMLRNLFLLRQAGEPILASLGDLTSDEKAFLVANARNFSTAHLHAAWQMALESQRSLNQSPEPGAALELLLLNLALLPQLLPVGSPKMPPVEGLREEARNFERPAESEKSKLQVAESKPAAPQKDLTCKDPVESAAKRGLEDWEAFCDFCNADAGLRATIPMAALRLLDAKWTHNRLDLHFGQTSQWDQIKSRRTELESALRSYCCGNMPEVFYHEPTPVKTHREMLEACENKPEIQMCCEILGATVTDCVEKRGARHAEHE